MHSMQGDALQYATRRGRACTACTGWRSACLTKSITSASAARRVLAIMEEPHALVLERVEGAPLAQKPNLQVLLRCRWAPGLQFRAAWIAGVAHGVAASLAYLHEHRICHGAPPLLLCLCPGSASALSMRQGFTRDVTRPLHMWVHDSAIGASEGRTDTLSLQKQISGTPVRTRGCSVPMQVMCMLTTFWLALPRRLPYWIMVGTLSQGSTL